MGILRLPSTRGRLVFQEFDPAYLQRLREGDPDTEKHFAAYFGSLLLIKLRTRVRSASLIEDIRQETFLRTIRVVRSGEGIRQPERLGAFVNSVCNNVTLEFLRSSTRQQQPEENAPEPVDHSSSAEHELLSKERKKMVRAVLEDLPQRDRQLLRAVFLEEKDKDEVCAEVGVDRDYLRVLLHRAKQHFRVHFLKAQGPSVGQFVTESE
jgi:RNA polymerase sigma-70 factor (ECF subfamily)